MPARSHGMWQSRTYCTWENMINRCRKGSAQNNRRPIYKKIKVCKRWLKFENFLSDIGVRPKDKTLERIDNSKDYTPANCKWATYSEQNRNHSRNIMVTFEGKTMCRKDWAKTIGISYQSLAGRIQRGWDLKRALTEKPKI